MGQYTETYRYDEVGNLLAIHHGDHWKRTYTYNEDSSLEPNKRSNRLTQTTIGNGSATTEAYTYDLHGNMTKMPHLSLMRWDYRDQLQATARQVVNNGDTPEATYYVYDASGQRIRKVTERQNSTRKEERIYLAGFEIFRHYEGDDKTVKLERETLHVMDDKQPIALVETRTKGDDGSPQQLIRYQYGNHLGSAVLESNDQGQVISYEEYYPYGCTSYQAVDKQIKATAKRYGYTGKERDEESGLYYHGARYYACWLARWVSTDKTRIENSLNKYMYVDARPIMLHDPTGNYGEVGHFYTVYFASLAAGFEGNTAFRNAVYAQMPDEVNALDAVQQQVNVLTAPNNRTKQERNLVQRGLHSLTGGRSAQERSITSAAISHVEPGTLEFGFLLHRFGDAYAHSRIDNESYTYKTGMGHASHGHTPDQVHIRPNLYRTYVRDLFGMLSKIATKSGFVPRLSQEQVAQFAIEVSSIRIMRTIRIHDPDLPHRYEEFQVLDRAATEKAQVLRIRGLSQQLMNKSEFHESTIGTPTYEQCLQHPIGEMKAYQPELEDTMSWKNYMHKHSDFLNGQQWEQVATAVESTARRVGQNTMSSYPLRSW